MSRRELFNIEKVGKILVKLGTYYDDFYENGVCFRVEVDVNDAEFPIEVIEKEFEDEAIEVFKDLCEKYRPKRDGNNKDGQVVKYLRELGFKAKPTIDSYSGIRKGIIVYFVNVCGKEQIDDYKPNNLLGTPERIAEAISDHLVKCRHADIEKGREHYGLK